MNLGSEETDFLQAGQLQFNSIGNTFITVNSGFEITGSNDVGNRLTLVSSGDITESPSAEISSVSSISFSDNVALVDEMTDALATDVDEMIDELVNGADEIMDGLVSDDDEMIAFFDGQLTSADFT